jgi:hypothetical protein
MAMFSARIITNRHIVDQSRSVRGLSLLVLLTVRMVPIFVMMRLFDQFKYNCLYGNFQTIAK